MSESVLVVLAGPSLRKLIREKEFELPVVMPTLGVMVLAKMIAIGGPLVPHYCQFERDA